MKTDEQLIGEAKVIAEEFNALVERSERLWGDVQKTELRLAHEIPDVVFLLKAFKDIADQAPVIADPDLLSMIRAFSKNMGGHLFAYKLSRQLSDMIDHSHCSPSSPCRNGVNAEEWPEELHPRNG